MLFNLTTKEVFTDDGKFIKQLHCPYLMKWQKMNTVNDTKNRMCSVCDKTVFDTQGMKDQQIFDLLKIEPDACLKIDLNQNNIKVENY